MHGSTSYGLECKASWCDLLLSGEKTVESRLYPLPEACVGQRIWLLASGGADGVASLGETVLEGCTDAQVVSSSHTFLPSWQAWGLHYVPAALLNAGVTAEIFGWEVVSREALPAARPLPAMKRMKRSLYYMDSWC
ncbi:hypothetical protein WJX84_002572 [Apatococcus fuscideae]|uniref:ASCH domain-containing protein n=1 Tax=Apatococcus fuscideae TaxID=2026836 RepID=A0AAW1SQN3_9CHLO